MEPRIEINLYDEEGNYIRKSMFSDKPFLYVVNDEILYPEKYVNDLKDLVLKIYNEYVISCTLIHVASKTKTIRASEHSALSKLRSDIMKILDTDLPDLPESDLYV